MDRECSLAAPAPVHVGDVRSTELDASGSIAFPVAMSLAGKVAIVTGGSRGIGASIAQRLARAGASVAVCSRHPDDLAGVVSDLEALGVRALATRCDVADEASVEAMVATVTEELGQTDVLVNNAGVAGSAPLVKTTLDEWNRHIAINATGPFLVTRAVLPGMIERGWGRVINIASVAGRSGARYIAAYSASKHAVLGLTRSVAAEVGTKGVTVNAVCPGFVDTPMTRASIANIVAKTGRSEEEALADMLGTLDQARLVDPEEVAHVTLSLCDEDARSVNGQAVVIDGGSLLS